MKDRAATAVRVAEKGAELIKARQFEFGSPDRFIGLIVDCTGIKVHENLFTRYTQNTICSPEQLIEAREAYLGGVHAMHGIKTAAQLEFVTSAPRKKTLRLATGVTPNYLPRATRFLQSLEKFHCVDTTMFAVNFESIPRVGTDCVQLVDYAKAAVQLPKFMLQHGGFTQFAPAYWSDNDVIVFTDADAFLQRNFTAEEIGSMLSVGENEMQVGYNRPNERQTLRQEADCIFPLKPMSEIEKIFPGIESMECRNFGFVVGRLSAWRELFRRTVAL